MHLYSMHYTFPTGMPELKLGLNDKLMFEATGHSTSSLIYITLCLINHVNYTLNIYKH